MRSAINGNYEPNQHYCRNSIIFFPRFLDFGRGKSVPLTPDGDNMEQIRKKSNTGRIVIDKTIIDLASFRNLSEPHDSGKYFIDKNGKIIERKKKTRLYSLGGNEPKKSHLVRMKTVGTFDLCMEVTALACGFNQDILSIPEPTAPDDDDDKILIEPELSGTKDERDLEALLGCISPKRHISSSYNSVADENDSIKQKKFRSLSTSSRVMKSSEEIRRKSVDFLDQNVSYAIDRAEKIKNIKSDDNIFKPCEEESSSFAEEDEPSKPPLPVCVRRRTFKKSKKIVRTDSELFTENLLASVTESCSAIALTSPESNPNPSRNISCDTVFSEGCHESIDSEKLESEYREQRADIRIREYKSDGDALDEIGKERPSIEWRNQSIDFELFETEKNEEPKTDDEEPKVVVETVKECGKKIRNDSESRTKSEGDKDTLYMKADSSETQSTEDDQKVESPHREETKVIQKQQSLFEKRFGKLKKMNKLLKVKRFSTSALYEKKKTVEVPPTKDAPAIALSALTQVEDFKTSSKISLGFSSPKSLRGKRFQLKKRKFSFFGKSQSNNDLNINLKSIASKLSLISKSNFDLSKHSSNLRLNAEGMYGKYGSSNEYRSDIITRKHGCTSPLSEAFYNETGSYQLTPMELFEKFCSRDFTGLYKHEPITDADDKAATENLCYKGAIKKNFKNLLKQNSEPKFKNFAMDQYFANPQVFEEEECENVDEEEEEEVNNVISRRASYGRQLEFDTNDQYFEGDQYYISLENSEFYNNPEEDIDEIYLMPERQGFLRCSEEILAIDETDEEVLEESNEDELDVNLVESLDSRSSLGLEDVLLPAQEISLIDEDSQEESMEDSHLKNIILEYVKSTCHPSTSSVVERSQSMDLLSNSSETFRTNSNSEYAFDTVRQISCSTSRLSLSLNSDIFDDITLTAPLESLIKTVKICEMDDFTLTPDGSTTESTHETREVIVKVSEQDKIKNELQSQYTIIDCDELEHDGENGEMEKFADDKSSFAEALNKEFDKLFFRAKNDSDTDITTTPSVATVLTAIKMPSRSSLEALPFEFEQEPIIGGIQEPIQPSVLPSSSSMNSAALHQIVSAKKEEPVKSKSKRSHSLGTIHKKKSNKCTPL